MLDYLLFCLTFSVFIFIIHDLLILIFVVIMSTQEEVSQNDLGFGAHYGLQTNRQHPLGNQLQSGPTLQVPTIDVSIYVSFSS